MCPNGGYRCWIGIATSFRSLTAAFDLIVAPVQNHSMVEAMSSRQAMSMVHM